MYRLNVGYAAAPAVWLCINPRSALSAFCIEQQNAEFERNMIIERVTAGMARAKSQGKVFGRPKAAAEIELEIHRLRRLGHGIIKTAKLAGVGVSTVQRVIDHR
jgi:DNA invertase Pin-like site-specific DNA recombinase